MSRNNITMNKYVTIVIFTILAIIGFSVPVWGSTMQCIINEDIVNIRTGPSTEYSVLCKVKKGKTLTIVSDEGQWYKVNIDDNKTGWVANWLVDVKNMDSSNVTANDDKNQDANKGENIVSNNGSSSMLELLLDGLGNKEEIEDNQDKPLDLNNNTNNNTDDIEINLDEIKNQTAFIICDDVNIRKESNADSLIIAKSNYGQLFNIVGKTNDFYQIELSSGEKGWVANWLVSVIYRDININGLLSGKTITLDAGHGQIKSGYSDSGAVGSKLNTYERNVALDMVMKLKDELVKQGATVVVTRSAEDTVLTLKGRTDIAFDTKSDIFVSVHANSSDKSSVNGTSTYFYAPSGNSTLYAMRNNRKYLAQEVQKMVVQSAQRRDIGIMEENFAVLRETKMPSILVETAFISNEEEEKLLNQDEFRAKIANGIANGIINYFKKTV